MQFTGQAKQPAGIVYITPMSRADSILALAMLYALEGKREARTASVAIAGGGLGAAAVCDVLLRFYFGTGAFLNSNRVLPVGLAAGGQLPPDSPAVKAVLEHRNEKGQEAYAREVRRISDTSEFRAQVRNALTGQPNSNVTVVLSANPAELLRTLELPSVRDLVIAKVKTLIAVEPSTGDLTELRKAWPTPIVTCSAGLGESLAYPGASIEKDFTWAAAHPVVDFYRASGNMPFDAPGHDLAAMLYAIRPEAGLLELTEKKSLAVVSGQKQKVVDTFVELVSAKPTPRAAFPRRTQQQQETPPATKKTP